MPNASTYKRMIICECIVLIEKQILNMKAKIFSIIILFLLQACTNLQEKSSTELYSNVQAIPSNKITADVNITLDTIIVDSQLSTSGDGFWRVKNDTLYFFDRIMGEVSVFDDKGKFLWNGLGLGRGPGEVLEEIGNVCPFNEGWLITEVYNVYRFDSHFGNKKMKFLIDYGDDFNSRKEKLYANPNPSKDIELYVPAYVYPQMHQIAKDKFLMKVSCEYPDFFKPEYYDQSAIMAEYNFEKGTITKLMGRYPPVYQNKIVAPFASHYYSPYKENQYLLSFAIDHKIYITNDSFEPIKAFGQKGAFINNDYSENNNMGYHEIQSELNKKAHYTSIYYCDNLDITFRMYKTGQATSEKESEENFNPSRMQIFKGTDLIGDIAIPENFEIIYYNTPYFYADGYIKIGEDRDSLGVFRFTIDYK